MLNLMSTEELTKKIASIKATGEKRRAVIQDVAVQAVAHSIEHRNIAIGVSLYNALNNADRRDSLVKYLETYGNFAWMKSEKSFAFFEATMKDTLTGEVAPLEWTEQYAAKVAANHWSEAKKEPEVLSVYDVEEAFRKFIAGISKKAKEGTQIQHEDLLNQLRVTFNGYVSKAADAAKAE